MHAFAIFTLDAVHILRAGVLRDSHHLDRASPCRRAIAWIATQTAARTLVNSLAQGVLLFADATDDQVSLVALNTQISVKGIKCPAVEIFGLVDCAGSLRNIIAWVAARAVTRGRVESPAEGV